MNADATFETVRERIVGGKPPVDQTMRQDAPDRAATAHLADVGPRDRQFHMALVQPSRRSLTIGLVERLQLLAERYVHAHLAPAAREDRAHIEHAVLFEIRARKDAGRARRLAAAHIAGTPADLRRRSG